ncbi:TonB-dependent receptor, partial [Enterococcus faecium]|uniref:TonB-dependent receptor domain-containing protein n=1 Tax=Enterococcus faecium TaxID=1352 RepID=UPI003F4370DF
PLPYGFQYRANAGAAVSKGFELELHARPLDGLDLTTGVGYNDARITATSAVSPQKVGDRVLQVPDWTGNAALAYTVPLSG